jgi:hypothetical protein
MLRRQANGAEDRIVAEWRDGWRLSRLWTGDEHGGAAQDAGFGEISIRDVTRYTFRSHRRLYVVARAARPLAAIFKWLGLRNSVQHGNVIASIRQFEALRNGCWFYGTLSARKPPW